MTLSEIIDTLKTVYDNNEDTIRYLDQKEMIKESIKSLIDLLDSGDFS